MSFEENWGKASADGQQENTPPPPGEYEAALTTAGAFRSKAENDVVKLEWRVVGPEMNGHEWASIYTFKSEGAASAAKSACAAVGVDVQAVSSLEELDSALKEFEGGYYALNVVENGKYVNTYVNGRLEEIPPDTSGLAAAAANGSNGDDDIPF